MWGEGGVQNKQWREGKINSDFYFGTILLFTLLFFPLYVARPAPEFNSHMSGAALGSESEAENLALAEALWQRCES